MRGPTTTLGTTPAAAEAGIDPGPFVSLTTDVGPTATAICADSASSASAASWVAADGGARSVRVTWAETFGAVEVGGSLLHVDHDGRLNLAVNRGSAADVLGARVDDRLRIARA
jgi:S-adenosylmethionine hydrolase